MNTNNIEEENDQWTDGGLRFESEKQAREAIAELGEPLIKVALGGVTDKEEGSRIIREAMGK